MVRDEHESVDERASDWPMFGRNPQHDQVCARELDPRDLRESWQFILGEPVKGFPVAAEQDWYGQVETFVYFGCDDKRVYCVRPGTGEEVWNLDLDGPVGGSLALAGNLLLVPSGHTLCAIDTTLMRQRFGQARFRDELHVQRLGMGPSSPVRWRCDVEGDIESSPTVHGENAFFHAGMGKLYCVSMGGQIRWESEDGWMSYGAPAVAEGRVYYGMGAALRAVDVASGEEVWSQRGNFCGAAPCVCGGRVYTGSRKCGVRCFDAVDGREVWTHMGHRLAHIDGTPVVLGGATYISGEMWLEGAARTGWALRAIDGSGEELWHRESTEYMSLGLAVGGFLYVTEGTRLLAVDAETGETLSRHRIGSVSGGPILAGETLVLGTAGHPTRRSADALPRVIALAFASS